METENSSFERILADHEQLRGLVAGLRELCESSHNRESWRAELATKLRECQAALVAHFRVEEEPTGFAEMAERFPRARRAIEGFLADHSGMVEELDGLVAAAGLETDPDDALATRTVELLDRFAKHEAAETALVQSLYTQDIGTGD